MNAAVHILLLQTGRERKKQQSVQKNNDKYFQYIATISLNHRKIESHIERASNIKPIINSYN